MIDGGKAREERRSANLLYLIQEDPDRKLHMTDDRKLHMTDNRKLHMTDDRKWNI